MRSIQHVEWALLATTLALLPVQATAENGLEAYFSAPVVAGEPATLVITLACCQGPPCGFYHGSGSGDLNWGDGSFWDEWFWWDSGPKPRPKPDGQPSEPQEIRREKQHVYLWPGRYRVAVLYRYDYAAIEPCGNVYGTIYDSLSVDVLPARGQGPLAASFPSATMTAGEVATVALSGGDLSQRFLPGCETCSARYTSVTVHWSDGSDSPPVASVLDTLQHVLAFPGRNVAKVIANWEVLPCDPACSPAVQGTDVALATIDVAPDPQATANGWLGVFFDSAATLCNGPVLPATRLYVTGGLGGASSAGIAGAEFRVATSEPGAFFFTETAAPGWFKIGSALGDGATFASAACVPGLGGKVAVLSIDAWPLAGTTDVSLFVDRHRNPTNVTYTEPMFILCDVPYYTAIPAGRGYAALLDPSQSTTGVCQAALVSVEARTWGQVKGLYR